MATRSPGLRTVLALVGFGLFGLLVTGCGPQSFTSANGIVASRILDLHTLVFWLSLIVFVGVEALIIWVVLRYRHRANEPLRVPSQTHGNTRLEIIWSIIPVIIVAILAVPTVQLIAEFTRIPETQDTIRVRVIAHQWWWAFEYPDLGVVTADELHIPTGQPIAFDLESADVIHSFWVPKLAGTLDTIPGRVNRMWFEADQPGEYWGQCKEFCGLSHALMKFRVIAQPRAEFDAWVQAMNAPAQPPQTDEQRQGALIFGAIRAQPGETAPPKAGICAACHTIRGTEARGVVGPDLTLFGRRTTVAAGIMDNTPDNLHAWLADPPAIKPGSKMPNYQLTEQELQALIAYLESLQ